MDEKMRKLAEYMSVHGDRDDGIFWIDVYVCQCMNRLDKTEPWLTGIPAAAEPDETLSAFMRPGTDSSYGIVHRMNALLRRVSPDQTERGPVFEQMLAHMDVLFGELKRVFGWVKIEDARSAFHELMNYVPAAKERNHSSERYKSTMEAKVNAFLDAWTALYELCQAEESARRALPAANVYERRMQESVAEIRKAVAVKKSRGRPANVALKTKCWLVRQWMYLVNHSECCRTNAKRRKVVYLDFWETFETPLKENGFKSLEEAVRALRTALANARDGLLGEECRVLVINHSRPGTCSD